MAVLKIFIVFASVSNIGLCVRHSRVFDLHTLTHQTDKYCRYTIGNCPTGAHVMCMYHRPDRVYGPLCHFPHTVTMTSADAEYLLQIVNGVRSRTSRGMVKNLRGRSLPRGYTIYKLQWDPEIASFAQVWANQCTLTHDRCRASRSFYSPGQAIGVMHFTLDWSPINPKKKFRMPGLTREKIWFSMYHIIESFYTSSRKVLTPEMVQHITPNEAVLHSYLPLLYGSITHMGCGISAFRNYVYNRNNQPLIRNTFLLVCNFANKLEADKPLYPTRLPYIDGYTKVCGCPPHYDEDDDCLCYPTECNKKSCNMQRLVVLPIVTIEDAPPKKPGKGNQKDKKNRRHNDGNIQSLNEPDEDDEDSNREISLQVHTQVAVPKSFSVKVPPKNTSTINVQNMVRSKVTKEVELSKTVTDLQNNKNNGRHIPNANLNVSSSTEKGNKLTPNKLQTNKNNTSKKLNAKNQTTPNDKDIIAILNRLQNDIKNTKLNARDKKIIDEKILKIYKTLQADLDTKENKQKESVKLVRNNKNKHKGRDSTENINKDTINNNYFDYLNTNLGSPSFIRKTKDIRDDKEGPDRVSKQTNSDSALDNKTKNKILEFLNGVENELSIARNNRKKGVMIKDKSSSTKVQK